MTDAPNTAALPGERLITTDEAMAMIGIKSPTTLRRLIAEDGFPAPIRMMKSRNSFSLTAIQRWVANRAAHK